MLNGPKPKKDTASMVMVLLLTYHGVGRGGEAKLLSYGDWYIEHLVQVLVTKWKERKNMSIYDCPFTNDAESVVVDVLFGVGVDWIVGKGLCRPDSKKKNPKMMQVSGDLARKTSYLLTSYVPPEFRPHVSSKSLRRSSLTVLSVGAVGNALVEKMVEAVAKTYNVGSSKAIALLHPWRMERSIGGGCISCAGQ